MGERIGEEALVEALVESDVALVAGVYGDPCTGVLDRADAAGLAVEISIEEKTAFSQALGASAVGKRSAVAIKQVGVNVASDPLVTSATHGIGAGLLLIAGDDPGAAKSQNEQDSRWYGRLAELPVLAPSSPDGLSEAAVEGLSLSETLGIPVILQVTSRLFSMSGEVRPPRKLGPPPVGDPSRAWGRLILDRHRYHHEEVWPRLREWVEDSPLNSVQTGDVDEAVISCGFPASLVDHGSHLALGYAHPLPEGMLVPFLEGVKRVLVVEEIAPYVEETVRALAHIHGLSVEVLGRLSGHLPRIGAVEKRHLNGVFERVPQGPNFDARAEPSGSIWELPCGGFEPLYAALDAVLDGEQRVAGDVGCAILHGYFPPRVIATAYALGTSVATAAGMSLSGRKGIAVIGDMGFLHSGITGLINAVEHGHDLLVIVLYNRISAMTPGAQQIKGLSRMKHLIEACGPDGVDEIRVGEAEQDELEALLARRMSQAGVHVVIAHAEPRRLNIAGSPG